MASMTEYGLFNDEGCVERCIYSMPEADDRLASYDVDDELEILPMCPCGHEGCEAADGSCELDEDEGEA